MRRRVLTLWGLVVLVIAETLVAFFFFLSPYSVIQNRIHKANVGVGGGKVPTSYVGEWHVHGSLMTIKSDGTGVQWWNMGPCQWETPNLDNPGPLCIGNAEIAFTANSDRTITGKFTKVWYTQDGGSPAPVWYTPTAGDISVGDAFKLHLVNPHLLITKWLNRPDIQRNGNLYWCGSQYSGEECGA